MTVLSKKQIRRKARYAEKTGAISRRPCEVCGDENAQKHHADYNAPLDVQWLCPKHHMAQHLRAIPLYRGEINGQAKLTTAQVVELRARYVAGRASTRKYARGKVTQRELAAEYGISQGEAFRIIQGIRWAHV